MYPPIESLLRFHQNFVYDESVDGGNFLQTSLWTIFKLQTADRDHVQAAKEQWRAKVVASFFLARGVRLCVG